MPRSPTVLTPPPGTLPFVQNTTIESGKANAVWFDLYQDGNTPRPIEYGGTGASNAADALNNLGAVGQGNFLDAYSVGDFYATVRTLDSDWLRRDGSLYESSDYPELAALLPALTDDVQWSNVSVGQTGLRTILARPGNSGFLIGRSYTVGGVFNSDIYSSSDGESWSVVATIGGGFSINDLAFGGGIYLASDGNGKVYTSNDSISWSSSASTIAGGTNPFTGSVTYGIGVFVAATGNAAGRYIYSSTDGATWTLRHTVAGGTSNNLNKIRFVNSTFVAVGNNGTMITSSDGINWTHRTTGSSSSMHGVTHGNGIYVMVGSGGAIVTTPNLTAFTARTSGTTVQLNDVAYSSAGFIAVGNGGVSRISPATSGIAWAAPGGTGTSQDLLAIAYESDEPSRYFVVQNGSPSILMGLRTLPTQFQVPSDAPVYGWIKARND